MNYIRTKDGKIYDIKKLRLRYAFDNFYFPPKEDYERVIQSTIVKEADTIEELCDEFVVIKGDCKCLYKQNDIFDCQDKNAVNDLIKNNEIYGAIWTCKGLIYVAKMNEKGELELI